jgi:hypothetical protein
MVQWPISAVNKNRETTQVYDWHTDAQRIAHTDLRHLLENAVQTGWVVANHEQHPANLKHRKALIRSTALKRIRPGSNPP